MPDELTLTKDDHAVFNLVPFVWHDENYIGAEIAQHLGVRASVVFRRLSRFVTVGIVERRNSRSITAVSEIRRVGK